LRAVQERISKRVQGTAVLPRPTFRLPLHTFLILIAFDQQIERLVFMNIFEHTRDIVGNLDVGYLRRTQQEFFELARLIRVRLGNKSYLLDKYVYDLLSAINETLAYDAADRGFLCSGELRGICADILNGEGNRTDHPFYETAKQYINDHPLTFQERTTQVDIYCTMLSCNFMEFAAPLFYEDCRDTTGAVMDIIFLRELYCKISSVVGEELMEQLNVLIRQRFLIAAPMFCFAQGMTNDLLYSLQWRDIETNKTALQLMLETADR